MATKWSVKTVASAIDKGRGHPRSVDEGSTWGRDLAAELESLGWRHAKLHSVMTKATFQQALEKSGKRVVITSSFFLGHFTQIEVS